MKHLTTISKCSLILAITVCHACSDPSDPSDKDDDRKNRTPEITTSEIKDITAQSATTGGRIKETHGLPLIACGICWDTLPAPTLEHAKTIDNTSTAAFASSVQGLRPNTTYHLRAYALNENGVGYGNERSFTTLKRTPVLKTDPVDTFTDTSAVARGSITDWEDHSVREFGICLDTIGQPTVNKKKIQAKGDARQFTANLPGLKPATTYHARTYLLTEKETFYGNEITFKTNAAPVKPTVQTEPCTGITETGATGHIRITNPGQYPVSEYGICLGKKTSPTTSDLKFPASTSGILINGLSDGTTYYMRGYLVYDGTTVYGNELTFTTNKTILLPTITTAAISTYNDISAVSGGRVTNDGGSTIVEYGLCWTKTGLPTYEASKASAYVSGTTYTLTITGLTPSTTYNVRAFARNGKGIGYGNIISFTTARSITPPQLSTLPISDISATGAKGKGRIDNNGGTPITECGICWSRTSTPTSTGDHISVGKIDIGEFNAIITGLAPSTRYYLRAYAQNGKGISYGNTIEFTTSALAPVVQTLPPGSVTETSLRVNGYIENGGEITMRGICWGTTRNPDIKGYKTLEGSGGGSFSSLIEGLSRATTYYFRAYATDKTGTTYYGNEVTARTKAALPTINASMSEYSGIDALCNANISENGGGTVTARGFCWSIVPNPTIADPRSACGSGNGLFSGTVGALQPETNYYIRAYATNETGTAYSNQITVTTKKNPLTLTFYIGSAPSGKQLLTLHFSYTGPFAVKSGTLVYGTNKNEVAKKIGAKTNVTIGKEATIYIGVNTYYYIMGYVTLSDGTTLCSSVARQYLSWSGH